MEENRDIAIKQMKLYLFHMLELLDEKAEDIPPHYAIMFENRIYDNIYKDFIEMLDVEEIGDRYE